MKTILTLTGMHCDSCKRLIESVYADMPGVSSCEVNVTDRIAVVEHDATVQPEAIAEEINALGTYTAAIKNA